MVGGIAEKGGWGAGDRNTVASRFGWKTMGYEKSIGWERVWESNRVPLDGSGGDTAKAAMEKEHR